MGAHKPAGASVTYVPPELIQTRATERNTQQVLSQQVTDAQTSSSNRGGTLLTGPAGLNSPAPTSKKTLLGQ